MRGTVSAVEVGAPAGQRAGTLAAAEMSAVTSDLTALLCSLVAIGCVDPSLVPGGAGEAEIATFIEGVGA
jgi:hypothetical protein